ncbi:unnamed protein product, partial [Meganyctiphanes norvegica]
AAAPSILVGLLLSSQTITEPSLNRGSVAPTQVPWYLDLQNFVRDCPGGRCDDTPIGLIQQSFHNNDKKCPGGRCGVTPVNVRQETIHDINKDCTKGQCDVTPFGLLQENIHNRGCNGRHCSVTPIGLLRESLQNKGKRCPGGWCGGTSNNPRLGTLQNLYRGCPGGRCDVTTEGPTLGGFQGTADPFEDYFVTENSINYESNSRDIDPLIFSEPNSFPESVAKENIQNSIPNSVVATFPPTVAEVPASASIHGSAAPPRNVVTVPSTPSIAPSRGFVYVDFGESQNGYSGEGSVKVVSQEIDNSRFQREKSIVDKDYDFWNSINGILGDDLGFSNENIYNQNSNRNINQNTAGQFKSSNVAVPIEQTREARSFTSYPGRSVRAPSRGFITVDFGGEPDDWGPGGFIRVVSHE